MEQMEKDILYAVGKHVKEKLQAITVADHPTNDDTSVSVAQLWQIFAPEEDQ